MTKFTELCPEIIIGPSIYIDTSGLKEKIDAIKGPGLKCHLRDTTRFKASWSKRHATMGHPATVDLT